MPDDLKITRGSGTVTDCTSNTIVLNGLPKIMEYTFDTVPRDIDLTKYKIYESYEGSYIRVFFYKGKWYTSTLNKLDIFRGNIGKMFMLSLCAALNVEQQEDDHEVLFSTLLKPDINYTFLLKPSEKLVCDLDPLPQNRIIMIEGDLDLPKRQELTYSSIDEMLKSFQCNHHISQGLVLINDDECIKIYDNEYHRIKKIRGNAKSLIIRYLEVRCTEHINDFLEMYPDMQSVAQQLEEDIYSLSKHLHNLYMQMFVKNLCMIKCSREEKLMLHCIHKNYISTKQRTIPTRINDLLSQLHPLKLNRLLNAVVERS